MPEVSISLRALVDRLSANSPLPLNYESLCEWVESMDRLEMDWSDEVPELLDVDDYARNIMCLEPFEVVIIHWPPGVESAVHHHEGFWGSVVCLQGVLENVTYALEDGELRLAEMLQATSGGIVPEPDGTLHKIRNGSATDPLVTLHFYFPALKNLDGLALYDLKTGNRYICNEHAPTASIVLPEHCYRQVDLAAFHYSPPVKASHIQSNRVPKPLDSEIERMISAYYNEQAATYDALDEQVLKRQQYTQAIDGRISSVLRKLNEDQPVHRVMHLACGTGRRACRIQSMSGMSYAIHGVDMSEDMAKQANSRGIEVGVASLTGLRTVRRDFDAVTLLYAYGHLPSEAVRLHVLKTVFDMLRPGGLFFFDAFDVADTNEWGPAAIEQFKEQRLSSQGYELGDVFYRRTEGQESAFLHYCSREGLSELVQAAGFTIREVVNIGYDEASGQESEQGKLFVVAVRP